MKSNYFVLNNYDETSGFHSGDYVNYFLLGYADVRFGRTVPMIRYFTLKKEAIYSSETLIPIYKITPCYIPEDRNLIN
jgi:hypothetical protein